MSYESHAFDRFLDRFSRLAHLYPSFVVRVGVTPTERGLSVVFLSATLDHRKPTEIEAPRYDPSVDGFQALTRVKPVRDFKSFVHSVRKGTVRIGGTRARILRNRHQGHELANEREFQIDESNQFGYDPEDRKGIAVYMNRQMHDVTGDLAKWEAEWRCSDPPYLNARDVVEHYFKRKAAQDLVYSDSPHSFVHLFLPLDMSVSDRSGFEGDTFRLEIAAPERAKAEETDASVVCYTGREPVRQKLQLERTNARPRATFVGTQAGMGEVSSIRLAFSYGGHLLEECTWTNPLRTIQNDALLIHGIFDPQVDLLKRYLKGEGRDAARDFEKGVAWLFHSAGFRVAHYGSDERIQGGPTGDPDIIAFSSSNGPILVVECTTKPGRVTEKLEKLHSRANLVRRKLARRRIVQVLATSATRDELAPGVINEAAQNEVSVLTRFELFKILGMIETEPTSRQMMSMLEGCIPSGKDEEVRRATRRLRSRL